MLLESELEAITTQAGMKNKTFNLHYESGKPGALKAAVQALCQDVEEAVKSGCEVCTQSPSDCVSIACHSVKALLPTPSAIPCLWLSNCLA